MEGENVDVSSSNGSGGGSSGGGGTSRWNPTRDQIDILESLYSQGLRTPSADQIQQITERLKEFGNIEGKNVFYWFQNHKARQRQKQKQETIAHMNHHYLHTFTPSAPIFHPPHPNVVCSPYYVPPGAELGFYQSSPRFILPAATGSVTMRRPRVDALNLPAVPARMYPNHHMANPTEDNNNDNVTLELFPLTPTGFSSATTPPGNNTSIESSSVEHYSSASGRGASRNVLDDRNPCFDIFSR